MALRDHNSYKSPNYLDAKEVMKLLHVRHFELSGEEGLGLDDVDYMLTPNDQIIHIYDDDNRTFGIASYVEGFVRFRHSEADSMKILCYLRMPSTRCLLKAVE